MYGERLRANRSTVKLANLSGINMLECYHLRATFHTDRLGTVIPRCPSRDRVASQLNH